MKIIHVLDAIEGGQVAFKRLKEEMQQGITTLGLATGSTPETLYQAMVNSSLDFSQMVSINLDEYVGLADENQQSYHYFMQQKLFAAKPFQTTFIPNGQASDLAAECQRYNKIIEKHPIDWQILGIGRNGHIGFNEPGTSFASETQIVTLTPSTIAANQRYFDHVEEVPTQAISMGIASIMKSKKIVLLAFGEEKAAAIQAMIEGPITESVPASCLQSHPDVVVIVDQAAASQLTK